MTTVLVLGGGPDAERAVSLKSAASIAAALRASGLYEVIERTIDRIGLLDLRGMAGDVIFPALHGSFGEGGPLQEIMEQDGRPYVGCRPMAARKAMDKVQCKIVAAALGVATAETAVFNAADASCPVELPVVVKPVHDGSSVGLHVCRTDEDWRAARLTVMQDISARPGRAYMIERYIRSRELTVGILDGEALPIIHIQPADGLYDYEAKYHRNDTVYTVNPSLPAGVGERVRADALAVARGLGVRHLARADFLLDDAGRTWFLEINTMPGFTDHSLVPKAAAATGLAMPALCARLVDLALRDAKDRD